MDAIFSNATEVEAAARRAAAAASSSSSSSASSSAGGDGGEGYNAVVVADPPPTPPTPPPPPTPNAEKIRPDIISYNAVINAWAKSRERNAARRAEAILRHMDRIHEDGSSDVAPDVTSYTSVINAWARSGDPDSADRAMSILRRMEEISSSGGAGGEEGEGEGMGGRGTNPGARPNVLTYNAVCDCLAKSAGGGASTRGRGAAIRTRPIGPCRY